MSDQDRIDELASQVRRLRWMNYGMAAVIAAGAMLAAGAVHQVSPIVKTKRIEIVADNGKTVLAMSSDSDGGRLVFVEPVHRPGAGAPRRRTRWRRRQHPAPRWRTHRTWRR